MPGQHEIAACAGRLKSDPPLDPARRVGERSTVTRAPADALRDTADDEGWRRVGWATAKRALLAWGPLATTVGLVAERAVSGVIAKVGHPAAPLDDAYIHFQYARAIAEGHPMRFQAGEPITSGATSLLWPAMLAPFWWLGARGDAIVWAAWLLSFIALGALAFEATALTRRLAGNAAGVGAGMMTVAFGGLVWCAASGMEVVPFAWAIARASRRASEWAEVSPGARTWTRRAELIALAWVAALLRPEGALTALFVAATLLVFARHPGWRERASALAAVAGAVAPAVLLYLLTGSARSNTAVAKLMPGNPYFAGPGLWTAVLANAKLLVGTLLNGEVWSAEFLPQGGAPIAIAGLAAVAWLGVRTKSRWRAAAVLLIALTMFAPCFYLTFLWNRLRYLWPFATGWLIGLASLARVAGDAAAAIRPRWRMITPITCGAFAGLFVSKLGWVMDDVAQSASGIDRQQVALGRWAKESLPPEARIGVNDTGAIAYFGDRKTFDIVGLTTQKEARYWIAGVASRLEHYERLYAASPSMLPTHFVIYREWMGMDSVLGEPLHEATVTDSTILGGQTMRAYVADWSSLGSGERPWTAYPGEASDALDVADLESEEAHEYALLGAREGEQVIHAGTGPAGGVVIDGGRGHRNLESFVAHLRPRIAAKGIVRLEGTAGCRVELWANHDPVAAFGLDGEEWTERAFTIPADIAAARTPFELRVQGGTVTTYHYWFAQVR
jgi:hypothetical protein